MRIIAGKHRSVALASVGKGDAGAQLRPTTDRVRESLFNVLTHRDVLEKAVVLDLFAGTGALGLEALSRGAALVTFVENGRASQRLIAENIERLRVARDARVLRCDARALPRNEGPPATLVFLDPPYGRELGAPALWAADKSGWLAPAACVIWEEAHPIEPPVGFALADRRRYGDIHITILDKL
ncbi:MAG: 16S rRNA (guanine(966)-N(2))-methyltransferase RsmD [Pseudomonadota bacterium]